MRLGRAAIHRPIQCRIVYCAVGKCYISIKKNREEKRVTLTNRGSGNNSSWARYRTSSRALDPISTSPLHLCISMKTHV